MCSSFQLGQPGPSRNAASGARTSVCPVLLPDVVLVLIILDILELSTTKKGQMAKKDRGLTDLDKLKPLKTIRIDLFLIFMVIFFAVCDGNEECKPTRMQRCTIGHRSNGVYST